jgi:ketosteroid isomerase-like protein
MTVSLSKRPSHHDLTIQEIADRLAIRELIDAYALCADRRDANGQMSLFTEDTEFLVYMDGCSKGPTQEIRGREGLRQVFENLNTYQATTHFNGQSTVVVERDEAAGLSYCLAHHVKREGQNLTLMVASIRYLDQFIKTKGRWYFRQRKLMVDWIDHRPLGTASAST